MDSPRPACHHSTTHFFSFFSMSNVLKVIIGLVVLGAVVGGGFYWYATRPTKAPSAVMVPNQPTTPDTQEPTETPDPMATSTTAGVYQIDSSKSTATFTLGEMLRGAPKTVVGTTNQVSGSLNVDRTNLAAATASAIRINARTFKTDSENRDRAIQRLILKTEDDANEFIIWTPTGLQDMPAKAELNVPFTFTMVGTLTMAGVTKEQTFRGTATFTSENSVTGSAEATVNRADYNLVIPTLDFVADVDEQVKLKIELTATR
jgi:polyisoprenoid-binding protein YceI